MIDVSVECKLTSFAGVERYSDGQSPGCHGFVGAATTLIKHMIERIDQTDSLSVHAFLYKSDC